MKYSINQHGKALSKKLYTIDEKNKIFSSTEDHLVLDFNGLDGWTFKTGDHCTFNTGDHCTFKTGDHCTFKTGSSCTFYTGFGCTFKTGSYCTFKTGSSCTFYTGNHCTFTTGNHCTFKTGFGCTFKTEGRSSVTYTRNDCFEVYKLDKGITYKLNEDGSLDEVSPTHIITIDGKDIEMSEESFTNLKEQLTK